MHILLAPDKYKGSMDALAVAEAMAEGIRLANPAISYHICPLADGGDGTEAILAHHLQGQQIRCMVHDPLMRIIESGYTLSADGNTAVIEMAQASGLALLSVEERDCWRTSSFGTGELIADALQRGAKRILIGIGGSATCDGGIGMAAALGYSFLDDAGQELPPVGGSLTSLAAIRPPAQAPWHHVQVEVACDVSNPLTGPSGAAHVYAPQKGASPQAVAQLDLGLGKLNAHWQGLIKRDLDTVPGAGAAGGMGAGLIAFLGATLRPGIDLVMDSVGFESALAVADLVLTGEGRLDGQTLAGKVIQGVCQRAQAAHVPVAALCGALDLSLEQQQRMGLSYAASVTSAPMPLTEAMSLTAPHLIQQTYSLVNLLSQLSSL